MQSMIFAAGMGTRLKPLTDIIPKALVPVGDIPLLQRVIEKLDKSGCNHFVINVHHKAQQIINFANIISSAKNIDISISDESESLLETGGGIRNARPLLVKDKPVLIHNVDILSNVNLREFYNELGSADALLLVSSRKTQRYLLFNDDMTLVGWTNISTGEIRSPYHNLSVEKCKMYAFAGIHIMGNNLLTDMDDWPDRFPIIDFYLERCKERVIKGHVKENLKLLDVGKLDSLEKADSMLSELL